MKNSEFLDETVSRLLKQNDYGYGMVKPKKAHLGYYRCNYRTLEGKACGIGLWLSDTQARTADREGFSAADCADQFHEVFEGVSPEMMTEIQTIHDTCADDGTPIEACCAKLSELKEKFPDATVYANQSS